MKKIGIIFAIFAIAALAWGPDADAQARAKKDKKGAAAASTDAGAAPYVVDLKTLKVAPLDKKTNVVGTPVPGIRNTAPFTQNYDDLFIVLPEFPVDVTQYQRITIRAKYFNDKGEEIAQGDGQAMVSVIEDINDSANIRGGGAEGSYKNVPLKEYNVGGYSGVSSKDRGSRIRYTRAPGGILFQNSNANVKFIEVSAIVFHNGDYKSE